eukprot:Em0003g113a
MEEQEIGVSHDQGLHGSCSRTHVSSDMVYLGRLYCSTLAIHVSSDMVYLERLYCSTLAIHVSSDMVYLERLYCSTPAIHVSSDIVYLERLYCSTLAMLVVTWCILRDFTALLQPWSYLDFEPLGVLCLVTSARSKVHHTGDTEQLLEVTGTIPVFVTGKWDAPDTVRWGVDGFLQVVVRWNGAVCVMYNIPIGIWLALNHPRKCPAVLVKPTPNMCVQQSSFVDQYGKVYLPYLAEWKHNSSDLTSLVQVMCATFEDKCPVYTKPLPGHLPPQHSHSNHQISKTSAVMAPAPSPCSTSGVTRHHSINQYSHYQLSQPFQQPPHYQPVEPPAPTLPGKPPVPTLPVKSPVPTLPVEPPVLTLPVEPPVPTLPVEPPVPTLPVEPPVLTLPVKSPVPTLPGKPPVPTLPVKSPVTTLPVEPPVPTLPVEPPVPTLPVEPPVPTLPVEPPVLTLPLKPPVPTLPVKPPVPTPAPYQRVPSAVMRAYYVISSTS